MAANPSYTLKTTAHGLAHAGELEGPLKYLAPIQTGIGLLTTFSGVVSGNPVAIGVGGVATTHGAAILFEHGESVLAKAAGEKPPEPPPPV
jgi:hypothetical protein